MSMIETQRLRIYTADQAEMEAVIRAETDESLRVAYGEMLGGCLSHPEQWEWYAVRMITLRDGTRVGDLCFKGVNADGSTEIGYGILDGHQGRGYATEAVQAAVAWAMGQPGIHRVEAETEPDNRASQRVLAKCGFLPTGMMGEEGPRFEYRNG